MPAEASTRANIVCSSVSQEFNSRTPSCFHSAHLPLAMRYLTSTHVPSTFSHKPSRTIFPVVLAVQRFQIFLSLLFSPPGWVTLHLILPPEKKTKEISFLFKSLSNFFQNFNKDQHFLSLLFSPPTWVTLHLILPSDKKTKEIIFLLKSFSNLSQIFFKISTKTKILGWIIFFPNNMLLVVRIIFSTIRFFVHY